MDLMDLLSAAGGNNSLGKIAGSLGIGKSQTSDLVSALAPALTRAVQKNTASDDGLAGLKAALASGNHQRYIDDPSQLAQESARVDGNNILGHLFGSKDVSRNVAAQAAEQTGISAGLIKKALPLIAGLAMGAMSKKTSAGRDLDTTSAGGGLGPLAGLIDSDGDGIGIDDVLGLAKKFF